MKEPQEFKELTNMTRTQFMNMELAHKQAFVDSLDLQAIKATNPNFAENELLKKYIALRILLIAEHAADKSVFNMTHNFRRMLGLSMKLDHQTDQDGGIRLWHLEEFGHLSFSQRHCQIMPGEDLTSITVTTFDEVPGSASYDNRYREHIRTATVDDLTNANNLRRILNTIQAESHYRTTLGGDLLQGMFWVANAAACYTLCLSYLLMVPTIPVSLLLYVVEKVVVDPIKWLVKQIVNPVDDFVAEVTSPARAIDMSNRFFSSQSPKQDHDDAESSPLVNRH